MSIPWSAQIAESKTEESVRLASAHHAERAAVEERNAAKINRLDSLKEAARPFLKNLQDLLAKDILDFNAILGPEASRAHIIHCTFDSFDDSPESHFEILRDWAPATTRVGCSLHLSIWFNLDTQELEVHRMGEFRRDLETVDRIYVALKEGSLIYENGTPESLRQRILTPVFRFDGFQSRGF